METPQCVHFDVDEGVFVVAMEVQRWVPFALWSYRVLRTAVNSKDLLTYLLTFSLHGAESLRS